eukprot:Platyproteum_vivax@DN2201_c0_g1_i1.p1
MSITQFQSTPVYYQHNRTRHHYTLSASQELCIYCFDVLFCALNSIELPELVSPINAPVFVTWMKRASACGPGLELRGCIGSLEDISLSKLNSYVIKSAFRDPRFNPIKQDEVGDLSCTVSILHTFEDCCHPHDWQIGKHGVLVKWKWEEKSFQATYLPDVPLTHNLSHTTTIEQLVRKAGWIGDIYPVLAVIVTKRYQSSPVSLPYNEYLSLRFKQPLHRVPKSLDESLLREETSAAQTVPGPENMGNPRIA